MEWTNKNSGRKKAFIKTQLENNMHWVKYQLSDRKKLR